MITRRTAYAVYYDGLAVEEMYTILPVLCEAIVFRSLMNPEPEAEPQANDHEDMVQLWEMNEWVIDGWCDEPEAEPKGVSPFEAAVQFTDRLGYDATVRSSPILAIAWAYLYALNVRHLRKLNVRTISIVDYSYAIRKKGYLGYNKSFSRYITLRNWIDQVHGYIWLDEINHEIRGGYTIRRVLTEDNESLEPRRETTIASA